MEIETMSVPGLVGAVHSIGIQLPGTNPFNPNVPHVTGAVARGIEINHSGGRRVCRKIKKLQADPGRVTTEESEVNSLSIFNCAHG